MGAGTPLSTTSGTTTNKRWWIIVAGTAAILVAGGAATQFWKSQPGNAAEEAGSAKLNAGAKKAPSERTVAIVGRDKITEEMLAKECISRYGKEVLEELINRVIIQQACETEGKKVTKDEVEAEIAKTAKRFQLDPIEWQKMLQAERNISPEQYRLSVVWPMLALRKLAETSALDDVADEDVEKEFERQYGVRVKCRMIMLDNFRRAQTVWNDCKKQEKTFEELAQEHSMDGNSKALGGAIPPIPRHSGNETIEKEAFKLKAGQLSPLIEVPTAAGARWAILKCEGFTDPVVAELTTEIRGEIVTELKERRTQESIAKVFQRIKEEAHVINQLTGTNSHANPATVNPAAKGTGVRQTSAEKPATPPAARPKTAASKNTNKN